MTFRRHLGVPGATALVVGHVIGVGIFLTPGTIIRTVASPFGVILVWAAIGVMGVSGAVCYGALAARRPRAGGGYVYLREAYGPRLAFLYGWKCLLIMDPGITAALATGFASYAGYFAPLGSFGARSVAILTIAILSIVHIIGVKIGIRVIAAVTLLKIVLILAITVAALSSSTGSWSHFTPLVERRPGAPALIGAMAGALVSAFFSFGGWWEVTRVAGEVQDPERSVPRALTIGVLSVMIIYIIATVGFIYVIPIEAVSEGQAFVAQVGQAIVGPAGGTVIALVVMVCVLGSLAALQMMAPRLYVAMAEDGLFPAGAAAVHQRFGTPARAIGIQAVLAATLVAIGSFDTIVAYFVFITVVFIAAVVASVFVLRRRDPSLAVPGYPWTPAVFLLMVAVLLTLLVLNNPLQAVLGVGIVAAALPVYQLIWRPRSGAAQETAQ